MRNIYANAFFIKQKDGERNDKYQVSRVRQE